MTRGRFPNFAPARRLFAPALLCLLTFTTSAQTTPNQPAKADEKKTAAPAAGDEKAEAVLRRAVEAVGGAQFLAIKTVTGRGFYTPFAKGVSGLPIKFVDYLAFPDRERTEFRGQGNFIVQTNVGKQGWLFDAAARTLKDVTPQQAEDFRLAMRTSIDNVLRGWWRQEGAKLTYAGRREAGLARRNEAVRLTYPDGFWVEFEFAAREGLPAKTIYERQVKNEAGEPATVKEEDRYLRFLTFEGVNAPVIIDHYRAGEQSSRINYDTYEFNRPLPDSLFVKPANIKALK